MQKTVTALPSLGKQLSGEAAMSATEGSHPSEAVQQAPGLWRTDLQQQDLSGGHFAAWEEPDLFATEIREAFRPLR